MAFHAGNSLPHPESDRHAATSQPDHAKGPRSLSGAIVETDIPARLDALPFGRFHVLVIVALGITWILDGLEVTLTGSRGDVAIGYCIGSALIIGAAAVEALWGIAAERRPLEAVSRPLALID